MNFESVAKYMESLRVEYGIPACDCIVHLEGRQVFRHMCGWANAERTRAVSAGDLYWMYSATKLVTCTAAMRLVQRGLLGLSDPVSRYLPEYANMTVRDKNGVHPARNVMRIRDLFTMSGGLSYDLDTDPVRRVASETGGRGTTRDFVRAFAETPLLFEPSEEFFYSLCHDVLAAVVEVVSGMRFIDYLRVNLFDPLGMEGPGFTLTEEKKKRFSRQYTYSVKTNTCKPCGDGNFAQLSPEYESGGGGLLCSADDYILLLSALSCGGRAQNGYEVLSEKFIDLMRQNTLNQKQTEYFVDWAKRLRVSPVWLESAKEQGRVAPCDEVAYRYGFGVRTLVNLSQNDRPVGEYGWDGAAGAYALVDPENHIAIFYAQHVLNCTPAFEVIQMKLRDMIYAAMSDVLNLTEP